MDVLALLLLFVAIPLLVVLWSKYRELHDRSERLRVNLERTLKILAELRARVDRLEPSGEAAAEPDVQKPTGPTPAVPPVGARPPQPPVDRAAASAAPPAQPPASAAPPAASRPPQPPLDATRRATGSREGIERELGTRVAVWVGAVALALAGIFLVKYSFEQGWVGPATRVALGIVFGLGLLGCGEWIRRSSANVAQGLAAAGIAVLFAALYAGVNLYELIPAALGFVAMALTTAAAVILAMRHGPFVALLGLVGGFLTPVWVSTGQPRPWVLLIYLLLLQAGVLTVSRRQRWWPVAALTVVGTVGWAAVWVVDLDGFGGSTLPIGLFLVASSFTVVASVGSADDRGPRLIPLGLAWSGVGMGLILLASLVGIGGFGLQEWGLFAILGTGCLVLGRREPAYQGLAVLAAVVSAFTLLVWGTTGEPGRLRFWSLTLGFLLLYAGGAYAAMWGSERPDRWAVLSAGAGIGLLLVGYVGLDTDAFPVPWGTQCLLLAAAFAGAALPVLRRRESMARGNETLTPLSVGVILLVSLAAVIELERAWITVAWALEVPLLLWIARGLRIRAVESMGWILAAGVASRLLFNPAVLFYPTGSGMPFNWLLYGYGLPLLAFGAAALLLERYGRPLAARLMAAGSLAFGFALVSLQIRQFFHPGELSALRFELSEWGAFTVVWLLYGFGLLLAHDRTGYRLFHAAGRLACLLAVIQGLATQGLLSNPLWIAHAVGETPIFNRLLWAFGAPALLALLLAARFRARGRTFDSIVTGGASLVFAFLLLSLEVRQAFQGSRLDGGAASNAEMYAYSLAWVLFALGLLFAGIFTRGLVLRYGSAAVMVLAVGKVFLVDTAHLTDLYRVFSFFGLGLSLMLLAFVYQKFVFADRAR